MVKSLRLGLFFPFGQLDLVILIDDSYKQSYFFSFMVKQ